MYLEKLKQSIKPQFLDMFGLNNLICSMRDIFDVLVEFQEILAKVLWRIGRMILYC